MIIIFFSFLSLESIIPRTLHTHTQRELWWMSVDEKTSDDSHIRDGLWESEAVEAVQLLCSSQAGAGLQQLRHWGLTLPSEGSSVGWLSKSMLRDTRVSFCLHCAPSTTPEEADVAVLPEGTPMERLREWSARQQLPRYVFVCSACNRCAEARYHSPFAPPTVVQGVVSRLQRSEWRSGKCSGEQLQRAEGERVSSEEGDVGRQLERCLNDKLLEEMFLRKMECVTTTADGNTLQSSAAWTAVVRSVATEEMHSTRLEVLALRRSEAQHSSGCCTVYGHVFTLQWTTPSDAIHLTHESASFLAYEGVARSRHRAHTEYYRRESYPAEAMTFSEGGNTLCKTLTSALIHRMTVVDQRNAWNFSCSSSHGVENF